MSGSLIWIVAGMLWCLPSQAESEGFVVAGQVTAADDSVAPQAKVRFSGIPTQSTNGVQLTSNGQVISTQKELGETVTDRAGRFRAVLPQETQVYMVQITDPLHGLTSSHVFHRKPSNFSPLDSAVELQLKLPRARERQVRVIDPQGLPVTGAKVFRLDCRKGVRAGFSSGLLQAGTESGITNSLGELSVPIAEDIPQWLWVRKEGFVSETVLLIAPTDPDVNDAFLKSFDQRPLTGDGPLEFRLLQGGSLVGKVISGTEGGAVEGAKVFVEFDTRRNAGTSLRKGQRLSIYLWSETDSRGEFQIPDLPAAVYNIVAWKRGHYSIRLAESLTEGNRQSIGDLRLSPGYRIHGQIWDLDSRLPANVEGGEVVARSHPLGDFSGSVQPNGRFEILVPPEPYLPDSVHLADHPLWKEFTNPVSTMPLMRRGQHETEFKLTVERRQPPLSDEEIPGELAKFRDEYRLAPGQWVKRVSRPFSRARDAFFQVGRLPEEVRPDWILNPGIPEFMRRTSTPRPAPTNCAIVVDAQDRIFFPLFSRDTATISAVIQASQPSMSMHRAGVRNLGPNQVLLKSDFVIRRDAPLVPFVEALNQELRRDPLIPLQVNLTEEKFTSLKVTHVPDETTLRRITNLKFVPDGYTGTVNRYSFFGDWQKLISTIAEQHLGLESVSMAGPDIQFANILIEAPYYTPKKLTGRTREDEAVEQKLREELQHNTREAVLTQLRELGAEATIEEIELPVVNCRTTSNVQ